MTRHIATMLGLEPEFGGSLVVHTHYVPVFAKTHPSDPSRQAGVCGQYAPLQQHSLDPTCPNCQDVLQAEAIERDERAEAENNEPLPRRWS